MDGMFRQKGDGVRKGINEHAENPDPSPGYAAKTEAPVWRRYVGNEAFQKTNKGAIDAENRRIAESQRQNRTKSQKNPWSVDKDGRLLFGKEEQDPNDWLNDPDIGGLAEKSLFEKDRRGAAQEMGMLSLRLQDPSDRRGLSDKEREEFEMELESLVLTGEEDEETKGFVRTRRKEIESRIRSADERRKEESRLHNLKQRKFLFDSAGIDWWREERAQSGRGSQPAEKVRRASHAAKQVSEDVSRRELEMEAQEAALTEEDEQLRAKLTQGVRSDEIEGIRSRQHAIAQERAKIEAGRKQLASEREQATAQATADASQAAEQIDASYRSTAEEAAAMERGEGLRSELEQRMKDAKLFASFTNAATQAADKGIRRDEDGQWDLPAMTLTSDSGLANIAKGLGSTLNLKAGSRLRDQVIGNEAETIREFFESFQQDNRLSDQEMETVWSDMVNRYRKWEDGEHLRVQSDGTIEFNPLSSLVLEDEAIRSEIENSQGSDTGKALSLENLKGIQQTVAERKAMAYAAASAALGRRDFNEFVEANGGDYGEGLKDHVLAYEENVLKHEGALRKAAIAFQNDQLFQGTGKVANTVLGVAGMLGSEGAADLSATLNETFAQITEGSVDTGLIGAVMKEAPSVAAQVLLTRGAGAGASALGASAQGASRVALGATLVTAGLQSAGLSFSGIYQELVDGGMDPQEAMRQARIDAARAGVNTMAITGIFGGGKLGGVEKVAVGREAAKVTLRDLGRLMRQQGVKNAATHPGLRKFLKDVSLSALGEGSEEFLDELTQSFLNQDSDTNLSDALDHAIEAFKVGAAIGGTLDTGMSALTSSDRSRAHATAEQAWSKRVIGEDDGSRATRIGAEMVKMAPEAEPVGNHELTEVEEVVGGYGTATALGEINRKLDTAMAEYRTARDEGRFDEAEQIDRDIVRMQRERETRAAEDLADATISLREIAVHAEKGRVAAENARESMDEGAQQQATVISLQAEAARALLKISAGKGLDSLTFNELNGLGIHRDGSPREAEALEQAGLDAPQVEVLDGGQLIILDDAIAELRGISERAANRVGMSETQARQKFAAETEESPGGEEAPASETTGQGAAPENLGEKEGAAPTNRYRVTGERGTTVEVDATDDTDAQRAGARKLPLGERVSGVEPVGATDTRSEGSQETPPTDSSKKSTPASSSKKVRAAATKRVAKLKKGPLKERVKVSKDPSVRVRAGRDGTLQINLDALADEAQQAGLDGKQAESWIDGVIDEELRHLAHLDAARELHQQSGDSRPFEAWMEEHYTRLWQEEFVATGKDAIVEEIYGSTLDGQPDWKKAMEGLRMMSQKLATGNPTEVARLWTDAGQGVIDHLLAALRALKAWSKNLSPALKSEIKALESKLSEYERSRPTDADRSQKPATHKTNSGTRPEGRPRAESSSRGKNEPEGRRIRGTDLVGHRVRFTHDGESLSGTVQVVNSKGLALIHLDEADASGRQSRLVPKEQLEDLSPPGKSGGWDPSTISGEAIDEEWTAFVEESGTLGIPRSEMPQIKAEDRSAMVQYLRSRGMDYTEAEEAPFALKPTQREFSMAKVEKAQNFTGGDRAILVSDDGHLVDGHHQWLAALFEAADKPIRVIKIKAPITNILALAKEMPSVEADDSSATQAKPAILPPPKTFGEALEELAPGSEIADDQHPYYDAIGHDVWDSKEPESQKKTPTFRKGEITGVEKGDLLSPAEAKKKLVEWKAQAKADGKAGVGSGKVVLSLFDSSGVWSKPWRDAGYAVYPIDVDPDGVGWQEDVKNLTQQFLEDNGLEMVDVILAQPPCTDFSLAGNRWFHDPDKAEEKKASLQRNTELVNHTLDVIEFLRPEIWSLENPIGTIKKHTAVSEPRLVFDPFAYGDDYTKRTQIFGVFNENLPEAMVYPEQGSRIHKLRGDDPKQKKLRSLTPEGFAYAYYMANRNYGEWSARRAIQMFPDLAETKGSDRSKVEQSTESSFDQSESTPTNPYDMPREQLVSRITELRREIDEKSGGTLTVDARIEKRLQRFEEILAERDAEESEPDQAATPIKAGDWVKWKDPDKADEGPWSVWFTEGGKVKLNNSNRNLSFNEENFIKVDPPKESEPSEEKPKTKLAQQKDEFSKRIGYDVFGGRRISSWPKESQPVIKAVREVFSMGAEDARDLRGPMSLLRFLEEGSSIAGKSFREIYEAIEGDGGLQWGEEIEERLLKLLPRETWAALAKPLENLFYGVSRARFPGIAGITDADSSPVWEAHAKKALEGYWIWESPHTAGSSTSYDRLQQAVYNMQILAGLVGNENSTDEAWAKYAARRLKKPAGTFLETHATGGEKTLYEDKDGFRWMHQKGIGGTIKQPTKTQKGKTVPLTPRELWNKKETQFLTQQEISGYIAEVREKQTGSRRLTSKNSRPKQIFEDHSVIAKILEEGGIMSKSRALKLKGPEWFRENRSLYDDAPKSKNPTFNSIYSQSENAQLPDQMADLVSDGDVNAMWAAIESAIESATRLNQQTKDQDAKMDLAEKQTIDFEENSDGPEDGQPVEVGTLSIGDVVIVDGEENEVIEVEADDLGDVQSVTLKDGARFGRQTLDGGRTIYVEETLRAPSDFELEEQTEESIKADQEAEQQKKQRERMAEEAAKPLTGSAGDLTADIFGEGDTPLFNERRDEAAPEERSEADQALIDAMSDLVDGLEAAPLDEGFTRSIPPEKIPALISVAQKYVEEGVNTPEAFAARLATIAGGKLRPYSQSLWGAFVIVDPTVNASPDWATLYAQDTEPEENQEVSPLKRLTVQKKLIESVREQAMKLEPMNRRDIAKQSDPDGVLSKKQLDEAIEAGITSAASRLASTVEEPGVIYQKLQTLYGIQPKHSAKTSTSKINQAYSTPAPMAYVAGRLLDIDAPGDQVIYEPSAGHGMLLIEAPSRAKVIYNEIDDSRHNRTVVAFPGNNWEMMGGDATEWTPQQTPTKIIANPPFGALMGEDGDNKVFQTSAGDTTSIDHAIMLKALESMDDKGRAVFIIGGPAKTARSDDARADHYARGARGHFFRHLHENYRVVEHFTVDGDLYAKQGAGWNVDILVIDGKGRAPIALPSAKVPRMITSWDELWETTTLTDDDRIAKNRITEEEVRADLQGGLAALDNLDQPATGSRENDRGRHRSPGRGDAPRGETGSDSNPTRDQSGRPDTDGDGHSRSDRSGNQRTAPAQGDARGSRSQPDRSGPKPEQGDQINQFQAKYVPATPGFSLDTLIPKNLAKPVTEALKSLIERRGALKPFVHQELGYPEGEDIGKFFAGEQIDALAMAIDNFHRDGALVVGDQTGIGKGRIVAGLIRWGVHNGITPVFVTKDLKLMNAMLEDDLPDTDYDDLTPAITNNVIRQEIQAAQDRRIPHGKSVFEEIAAIGGLPEGVEAIFTTYAQLSADTPRSVSKKERESAIRNMQAPPGSWRMDALKKIAPNAVFILDESHLAGGQSSIGFRFRDLLNLAKHAYFSSATFAKRPENMGLYFRTNMKLVSGGDMNRLIDMMESGGVPAMQLASSMLATDGQMLRRERSFDGIDFETVINLPQQERDFEIADSYTEGLRRIVTLQTAMVEAADVVNAMIRASGKRLEVPPKGTPKLESTNFSSKLHNMVSQYLLAIKAESAVEQAIGEVRAGRKVVVTVQNTMEAALRNLHANGLPLTFKGLMLHYVDTMRYFKSKSKQSGEVEEIVIDREPPEKFKDTSDQELQGSMTNISRDKEGEKIITLNMPVIQEIIRRRMIRVFERAEQDIKDMPISSDMPLSPIDYMRQRVEAEGITTNEITGRKIGLDDQGSVYERSIPSPVTVMDDFNNGNTHFLVLNQSGSTGISLHASEKFRDKRQRTMIVVQPNLDINEFMQTLGRIHRSGQVTLPRFVLLQTALPAENRPAAILGKKMSMLNANTTSNDESAVSEGNEAVDVFNKYGDEVVHRVLQGDQDLVDQLAIFDSFSKKFIDSRRGTLVPWAEAQKVVQEQPAGYFARFVTGYAAILPAEEQGLLWEKITNEYQALISYLDQLGQNDLKAEALDLKAKTVSREMLTPGNNDESIFAQPSYVETVEAVIGRKPIEGAEAEQIQREGDSNRRRVLAEFTERGNAFIESEVKRKAAAVLSWDTDKEREFTASLRNSLNQIGEAIRKMGNFLTYARPDGSTGMAVVEEIIFDEEKPLTPSKQVVVLKLNDTRYSLRVPVTQFTGDVFSVDMAGGANAWMQTRDDSSTRSIVTGNLLAALSHLGRTGQVVSYTTDSGDTQMGILLPNNYTKKKEAQERSRTPITNAAEFRRAVGQGQHVRNSDNTVQVRLGDKNTKPFLILPASRSAGGKYWRRPSLNRLMDGGEFEEVGGRMKASFADLDAVFEELTGPIGDKLFTESSTTQDERDGLDAAPLSASRIRPVTPGMPATPTRDGRTLQGPGVFEIDALEAAPLKAFHGTPHKVDKFSTEKIGTGEGAQVYGWGLYFTETPKVAENYQGMLADPLEKSGQYDRNIAALEEHLERVPHDEFAKRQLEETKRYQEEARKRNGNLYTVDLKVEPEELLDWDRALSEQSPHVKKALLKTRTPDRSMTLFALSKEQGVGAYVYKAIAGQHSGADGGIREASLALHAAGIKGIRYMDGDSRNRPFKDVKREFLAALPEDAEFDDLSESIEEGNFTPDQARFLNALEKDDWLGFDYPAQAISAALGPDLSHFETSQELKDAIEALRGARTYNYVIFNEEDIEITNGDDDLQAAPLSESKQRIKDLTEKGRGQMAGKAIEDQTRKEQEAFRDEGKVVGDPDLANISDDESVREEMDVIDQMRKHTKHRESKGQWEREGRRMAQDRDAVQEKWLELAYGDNPGGVKPEDVVAARVAMESMTKEAGADFDAHSDAGVLMHGYREARANQARVLAAGTDPFKSPEERHRAYLAGALYALPAKVLAKIEGRSKTPEEARKLIRAKLKARLQKIDSALRKMGVSIDQITSGQVYLSLKGAKVFRDTIKDYQQAERTALRMIQKANPIARIRKATGLSDKRIEQLRNEVREKLRQQLRDMVASGMKLEDIRDQIQRDGLAAAPLSSEQIDAELDRILDVGFGLNADYLTAKPKRKAPKKKDSDPIQTDWTRPAFTEGLMDYEFDTADRAEVIRRVEAIRTLAGAVGKIDSLPPAKKTKALEQVHGINRILAKYGTDVPTILSNSNAVQDHRFDLSDRHQVMMMARTISALDADVLDKSAEYYYSSILSGIQTMMVNATTVIPATWEATVGRGIESAVNAMFRDKRAASLGETKYILRAMGPMMARAWTNAAATWGSEMPVFEEDILGKTPDLEAIFEGRSVYGSNAIAGTKGRIIRIPSRILLATDEMVKTMIACSEVGAMAYRISKELGRRPGTSEFDEEMRELVNTPGSLAWQWAAQKAYERTFTAALPGQMDMATGKKVPVKGLGDVIGFGAGKLASLLSAEMDSSAAKAGLLALRLLFFPFQRVPFNIIRTGVRRTLNPVSLFDIGVLISRNLRVVNGKWTLNAQGEKAEIVERLSQQAQGALLLMMVIGMGEGDEDDLEKPILITGSKPWKDTRRGERELGYRMGLGPYEVSMRLPNGSRFSFSYGRLEPFATVLGATIDTVRESKRYARGKQSGDETMGKVFNALKSQITEKTFLRGVSDLYRLSEGDANLSKWVASRIGVVVPNFIRQPVRETDPAFREKPDGFLEALSYELWPSGKAEARRDVYGDTVEKDGSALGRIFDFTDSGSAEVGKFDAMIYRYAQEHPSKESEDGVRAYFPERPGKRWKDPVTGENREMTPKQHAKFAEVAGKRGLALLQRERFNFKNPTEPDMKRLRSAILKGREDARKILYRNPSWRNAK